MKIISVVGARPNFMKVSPIISVINKYNKKTLEGSSTQREGNIPEAPICHMLLHTGQHYDENMSDAFFGDLNLPKPDIYLGVGSASHAVQTAEIMNKFETVLLKEKPDIVIVVGDVNSTLACALVASKISYDLTSSRPLIAHVEAGLRSFDRSMPEEINRILTDHISDILFVTEENGIKNLKNEGISQDKIHFVGNTMIDTLLSFRVKAKKSKILQKLGLINSTNKLNRKKTADSIIPYGLLTLHRPSNVDNKEAFWNIIQALNKISRQIPVIFPAHPRTQNRIKEFGFGDYFNFNGSDEVDIHIRKKISLNRKIICLDPLGYLDFLFLMMNAKIVLTDSGGIQEETTCLGIPCVTIRENTERPTTVIEGTNIIAGVKKDGIVNAIQHQLNREVKNKIPKYWDGKTAFRILDIIIKKSENKIQP